jgi:hypothetical protein
MGGELCWTTDRLVDAGDRVGCLLGSDHLVRQLRGKAEGQVEVGLTTSVEREASASLYVIDTWKERAVLPVAASYASAGSRSNSSYSDARAEGETGRTHDRHPCLGPVVKLELLARLGRLKGPFAGGRVKVDVWVARERGRVGREG